MVSLSLGKKLERLIHSSMKNITMRWGTRQEHGLHMTSFTVWDWRQDWNTGGYHSAFVLPQQTKEKWHILWYFNDYSMLYLLSHIKVMSFQSISCTFMCLYYLLCIENCSLTMQRGELKLKAFRNTDVPSEYVKVMFWVVKSSSINSNTWTLVLTWPVVFRVHAVWES